MRISITAASHRGLARDRNEDHYGASGIMMASEDGKALSVTITDGFCLAVVADGLGGHPCGDRASRLAVEHLLSSKPADAAALAQAVREANEVIVLAMSAEDGSLRMGSTLAAVIVSECELVVVNVGDSPVFEFEEGRMQQLTIDDVPPRNTTLPGLPSSTVTQTLGGSRVLVPVDPHVFLDDRIIPRRILLCTDGLTNFVPRELIVDSLQKATGEDVVESLINRALEAGAPDNVTVLIVDVETY